MQSDYASMDTQQRILCAGKTEFLACGFEGASLRTIARNAGVTTGAIYGYYADKRALFQAIVGEPGSELYSRFVEVQNQFAALPPAVQQSQMFSYSSGSLKELFDLIYGNFDAFKLILCCSGGTEYENYLHSLVDIECQNTLLFLQVMQAHGQTKLKLSDNLNHILASAYFSAVFEVVAHDMARAEADEYVAKLTTFFHAGWQALLEMNPT